MDQGSHSPRTVVIAIRHLFGKVVSSNKIGSHQVRCVLYSRVTTRSHYYFKEGVVEGALVTTHEFAIIGNRVKVDAYTTRRSLR